MPVMGALSDRYGRRPVILLSNFGLALDYVLMALAPNLAWLFVGRVISGITRGERQHRDGVHRRRDAGGEALRQPSASIGMAFGIGFVLGPAFGGLLGSVDPRLPFWAAAGFSLANAALRLFVLPESLPASVAVRSNGAARTRSARSGCCARIPSSPALPAPRS